MVKEVIKGQGHGSKDVTAALEQVDKKTHGFNKTILDHVFSFHMELCMILTRNQEIQEQVATLREETTALKAALAENDGKMKYAHQMTLVRLDVCLIW